MYETFCFTTVSVYNSNDVAHEFRRVWNEDIVLEDRYERKSVIVTSQLPIAKWFDYIAEPTIADAILDRLISNANRVELKGESMRRKKSK